MGKHEWKRVVRTVAGAVLMVLLSAVSTAWAQTTVTAMWDRNTDPYTAGYRLYYGTVSGSYQWSIDAGNQVSAPINLSPGNVYYFVVRAYNASYQEGPPSNEAQINLTQSPAPTAQITATLQPGNVAALSWQTTNAVSASINGTTVALSGSTSVAVSATTTFTLTARAADGRTATASATVTVAAPAPTAQITATLQPGNVAAVSWQTTNAVSASINGTTVALSGSTSVAVSATTTFTLTARAADGRTATASATVTVTPPATQPPSPPTSLTASVSSSTVTFTWQRPVSGGTPTHYLLSVGTAPGWSDVVANYNVGNTLSVSGALPRGTYYARVRAANAAGVSLGSNEVNFRIGRRLRSPTGFRVSWQGTTATFSWVPPSGDSAADTPTNYVVDAGSAPGLSDVASVSVGNVTSFSASVSSGLYYVRVRAQNAEGESDPSEEIELVTPGAPQAPTNLISLGSGSTVDLRWTAPTGGYAATGYLIEAGSAPGRSDLARLRVGNITRFVTNAPPGTYYVRVRATNDNGPGAASNEIVVRR